MKSTAPQPQKKQQKRRQVIRRLLSAVDRSIAAAEEAKQARAELDRLAREGQ